MRQLMRVAGLLDVARLVLVGDRSQLRAVEAGQPFRQLQDAGMTTARMDDILRQRNPELRAAVLSVLEGDPGAAVEMLGAGVHEVDYDDLGVKAAEAWLALDAGDARQHAPAGADACVERRDQRDRARGAGGGGGAPSGKALRIRAAGQSRHDPGREGRRAELPGGRHGGVPAGPGQLPGEEGRHPHGDRDRARHGHSRPPRREAAADPSGGRGALPAGGLREAGDRAPRGRPDPLDPERQRARADQRREGRNERRSRATACGSTLRTGGRSRCAGGRSAAAPISTMPGARRCTAPRGRRRTG